MEPGQGRFILEIGVLVIRCGNSEVTRQRLERTDSVGSSQNRHDRTNIHALDSIIPRAGGAEIGKIDGTHFMVMHITTQRFETLPPINVGIARNLVGMIGSSDQLVEIRQMVRVALQRGPCLPDNEKKEGGMTFRCRGRLFWKSGPR